MELQRALDAGFDLIGVNNRNLHTFQVDLNTSLELAELMPAGVVKVAESGIETRRRHRAPAPGRLRRLPDRRVADARAIAGDALRELLAQAVADRLMMRQL